MRRTAVKVSFGLLPAQGWRLIPHNVVDSFSYSVRSNEVCDIPRPDDQVVFPGRKTVYKVYRRRFRYTPRGLREVVVLVRRVKVEEWHR